jgi:predicted NBD/HSP70 family sugar kinase
MKSAATGVLGIDVGGTKIAAGIVDPATGAIILRETITTRAVSGGAVVLADTVDLAKRLIAAAKRRIVRIGLGVPQLVDNEGRIRSAYNFDWTDLPVRERLSMLAPTTIESDVRAAARAEALFGAGKGRGTFAYVSIGTGVSYCLVIDGRPHVGANGFAIHFASSALHVPCAACGHVNVPVVEEIASGRAIADAFARRTGRIAGGTEVLAAANAGDAIAIAILNSAADQLGSLIALVVNMLDPEAVLLGGGLGLAAGLYRDRLIASTRAHIWADACRSLPILPAALGNDAGVIGAALAGCELSTAGLPGAA